MRMQSVRFSVQRKYDLEELTKTTTTKFTMEMCRSIRIVSGTETIGKPLCRH